ncbi:MAG TPA: hypothetical protein VN660_02110 [Steroidobacteraceae bacterium]|nr:hypothetical protein [Steroidobacteraceae bacterium]
MRQFSFVWAALLVACSDPHGAADRQQLQGEIDALNARMTMLVDQQTRLAADAAAGSWILWLRSDIVKTSVPIFGLAPARPMGAFSSKDECERAAQETAEGHGARPGATEYLKSTSTGVDRIFFSCLPKGIDVQR